MRRLKKWVQETETRSEPGGLHNESGVFGFWSSVHRWCFVVVVYNSSTGASELFYEGVSGLDFEF